MEIDKSILDRIPYIQMELLTKLTNSDWHQCTPYK